MAQLDMTDRWHPHIRDMCSLLGGVPVLVTTIKHGELEITLRDRGAVEIYRPSSAERMVLSASEWVYLQRVCELHGWPIAPPSPSPEG